MKLRKDHHAAQGNGELEGRELSDGPIPDSDSPRRLPCPYCGTGSQIHPVGAEACARFEWHPIETAPRTGKTILVFGPHAEPYTAYFDWLQESFCDRCDGEKCQPEWWMPLPKNPMQRVATEYGGVVYTDGEPLSE